MADKPLECGYTEVTLPTEQPSVQPSARPVKANQDYTDPKKLQFLGTRLKQIKPVGGSNGNYEK